MGIVAMFSSLSIAQTSLQGKVTDATSNEPILFGTVALMKDGSIIKGVETDLDGNYYFSDINPGSYDVEASYVGYTPARQTGVLVKADKSNKLNLQIAEGVLADEIVITEYKVPLIEFDNTSTGGTVTSEDIKSLPTKNVNAIAATTAGIAAQDGSDDVSVRGGRPDGTVYYIDGVRVTNAALIPQSEISQLQVITGGIEAKYGDVTGGLISLTTKGPSQQYSAGVEVETSELTDAYGYNLLSANVSGPLLKREDGQSILGFRFSGQFLQIDDVSPSAVGVYRASPEDIAAFEADPLYFVGSSQRPSVEQFQNAQLLDARPNNQNTDIDLTAKIDALITDNIDVTLSASYYDRSDFFTPGADDIGGGGAWSMFNWQNNPEFRRSGYRGSFRFRHKIGQQSNDPTLTEEEKAELGKATFRNLSYSIQLGVEKDKTGREDIRFEDRFFEYGYYGNQVRNWQAIESQVSDTETWTGQQIPLVNQFGDTTQVWAHQGSREVVEEFLPGTTNSVLSSFNSINGLPEPELRSTFGNLYSNVGREYNTFTRTEQDVYNGNVTVSFDLTPGGSEKGRHNIQLGLIVEQRVNRAYSLAPRNLWLAARINANNHIAGVNTDVVVGSFQSSEFPLDTTFLQYQNAINVNDDSKFYKSVRTLLNDTALEEFVNVDGIDPSLLSLDMFSARELNDQRLVNYYGYDYTGEKLSGDVTFEDFFTSRGEDGLRDFKIGANTPIYGSAYIQDKFAYKDIIFKIGLRMDYFDANTKVLKDNYSLYDIQTKDEFFGAGGGPASVPGDAKVYVAGEGSDEVIAFRDGDVWLQPNGTETTPALLFESAVTPAYSAGENLVEIREEGFDVDGSFEDYAPQINWMPRLAFSFPISDDAGFFAHYDVLYQRPTSNNIQTALNYFNLGAGDLINNPNLKPVRTVDYEVGYKQKLTNSSAMTLSAYYREQRDMIQRRIFANVPSPIFQYETFDNLDFGTVKGFSFTYDRRRVGNIKLTATYTLQFADGSGSDANSSGGINSRGPIRNLIPLSYDERHRITSTIDYRYGSGKKYTGPRIGGVDIFANTGLNLIVNAVSGRPYTKRQTVQQFGGVGYEGAINGARLPWNATIDARLDKDFTLQTGEEGSRPLYFNVYVRVQNLLDTKNVYGVYSVTGSEDDDGYIISSFGQDRLAQVTANGQSEEVFLAQYNYRLLQPGFFSLARRIYIGALVNF